MIKPIEHYSLTNPATVYDEEAMTTLKLAGRTAAKVNEVVASQNALEVATNNHMQDQDEKLDTIEKITIPRLVADTIKARVNDGTFDKAINEYMGNLDERVNNLVENTSEGSTTMDAELIDIRVRHNGATYPAAGAATRAIDNDLSQLKQDCTGVVDLHAEHESFVSWDNGQGVQHFATINNGVCVLNIDGTANYGVATKAFDLDNQGKIYIEIDATPADGAVLSLYYNDDYGAGNNLNRIAYLQNGFQRYTIDPATAGSVRVISLVHQGGTAGETYTHIIRSMRVYQSSMRDAGFEEGSTIQLIRKNAEDIAAFNSRQNLFNDVTTCIAPFMANTALPAGVIDYDNNTATITTLGNDGVSTPILTIDPNNLVHVLVNIKHMGTADYTSQVYVANAAGDQFAVIGTIKGSGIYDFTFDPAYYAVYGGFGDVHRVYIIHHAGLLSEVKTTILEFEVYQDKFVDVGLPSDMVNAVVDLARKTSTGATQSNNYLTGTNGEKYALQVDASGNLVTVPVIPSKAFYMGNSLIAGYGHGMAASNPNADYYALINAAIRDSNPTFTASKIQANPWEGCSTSAAQAAYLENTIKPLLSPNLDLIVVQLGDNVKEENLDVFRAGAIDLIKFLRSNCPRARVCWAGAWFSTSERQGIIADACTATGAIFVPLWDLNTPANQSTVGATITKADGSTVTVETAGEAAHPGDNGFKAIANRVLFYLGISATSKYYT